MTDDQAKTPSPGGAEPEPPTEPTEAPLESEDEPTIEHTASEEGN